MAGPLLKGVLILAAWPLFYWASGIIGETFRTHPWFVMCCWLYLTLWGFVISGTQMPEQWNERRVSLAKNWFGLSVLAIGLLWHATVGRAWLDVDAFIIANLPIKGLWQWTESIRLVFVLTASFVVWLRFERALDRIKKRQTDLAATG